MLLFLGFMLPSAATPLAKGAFEHASVPALKAAEPHVVPRVVRLKRSTKKAAVAALQPLLGMATDALLPYASEDDLEGLAANLKEKLAAVRKRRRAMEIVELARPVTGNAAAAALGAGAAGLMSAAEGSGAGTVRGAGERSSLEAAAQGAWSAVNGFMAMLPAASTAKGVPLQQGRPQAEGGDGAQVSAEVASWASSLDDVSDGDDDVPLAFVEDDELPAAVPMRHSDGGGVPVPTSRPKRHTVMGVPGYTMRKRPGSGGGPAVAPPPVPSSDDDTVV